MNIKALLAVLVFGATATVVVLAADRFGDMPAAPVVQSASAAPQPKATKITPAAPEAPKPIVAEAAKPVGPQPRSLITVTAAAAPEPLEPAVAEPTPEAEPNIVVAQNTAASADDPRPQQLPRQELESILAPIALYPDQVLSQILMASTYPLDVIEAARWVERPENAVLRGEGLSDALLDKDWDLSVKALVPVPQVLQMMNTDLQWMGRVGQAFIFQDADVMDAVQRLRRDAMANGTLRSDARQRVVQRDGDIIIEPADPAVVYVPVYKPVEVYTRWAYPDYPPVYIPPPVNYVYSPYFSYTVVPSLWAWQSWDWGHRRIIIIDHDKYRRHNRGRDHAGGDHWRHDPQHRHGVGFGSRFRGPFDRDSQRVGFPPNRRMPEARDGDGSRFDRDGRRDGNGRGNRDGNWDGNRRNNGVTPPVNAPPQESVQRGTIMEAPEDSGRRQRGPRPGVDRTVLPQTDPNSPENLARNGRRFRQDTSITAPPLTNMPSPVQPIRPETSIGVPSAPVHTPQPIVIEPRRRTPDDVVRRVRPPEAPVYSAPAAPSAPAVATPAYVAPQPPPPPAAQVPAFTGYRGTRAGDAPPAAASSDDGGCTSRATCQGVRRNVPQ